MSKSDQLRQWVAEQLSAVVDRLERCARDADDDSLKSELAVLRERFSDEHLRLRFDEACPLGVDQRLIDAQQRVIDLQDQALRGLKHADGDERITVEWFAGLPRARREGDYWIVARRDECLRIQITDSDPDRVGATELRLNSLILSSYCKTRDQLRELAHSLSIDLGEEL